MLRKFLGCLMLLTLLLTLLPMTLTRAAEATAPAETPKVEKPPYSPSYTYTSGSFRSEMYFSEGLVFLSGTGDRSFTDPEDAPWFSYLQYVKYVYIEEGLTSLGKNFFRGCYNLETIEIPSTVTSIGDYAFYGCSSLKEITLPDTVTSIGNQAFRDCTALTSFTLPAGLTTLADGVFGGCTSLTTIVVPPENTAFASENGYLYNKAMNELYLAPASLSGEYHVPESITVLRGHCMTNSDGISDLYLHENVKANTEALAGIAGLQSITVAENNPNHQSMDGVLFNKNGTALQQYPTGRRGSYTIHGGVTYIVSYAFAEVTVPFAVTFSDTVETIQAKAFYNSTGLTELHLNGGIKTIHAQAFQNCTGLTGLELPAALETLRESAFENCTSISSVKIPANVLRVWDRAFYGCTGLETLSFAGSTAYIHLKAFANCSALAEVTLPGTLKELQSNAFVNCSSLKKIVIPELVTSLGFQIFQNCTALEEVVLPDGLTSVGYRCFENCNLQELFIPGKVTAISSYAFYKNPSLQKVHFLGDLPGTFEASAFNKCADGLTLSYLPGKAGWTTPTWGKYPTAEFTCTQSSTATCTQAGLASYTCEVCKASAFLPAPPTGHSFGAWFLDCPPDVGQEGLWKRVCALCNDVEEETVPAFAEVDQTAAVTDNNDYYKYAYDRWASPIRSYLTENADGSLTRVEYTGTDITVEVFNQDFTFRSRKVLPMELPLFGGFYEGRDYYFLVYGQTNREENNEAEVIRVVRYTKDWVRHGYGSLKGANTTVPFDAGSVRMAQYGDMLYVHTAHEMYTGSDGLNHQANLTFSLSIPEMELTDSRYTVSNNSTGYVSHSFNQFILIDGDQILTLDHGDAYPRSLLLAQYKKAAGQKTFTGSVTSSKLLPMTGAIGANDTGVNIGGFQASDKGYLVAGCSIVQDGTVAFSGQKNVFVSLTPRGEVGQDTTVIRWITSYVDGVDTKVNVSMPHLVPITESSFLLMWKEDSTLCYLFLNGAGEPVGEIYRCTYPISDCSPIVYDNQVLWYVTDNTDPAFFAIPLDNPGNPTLYNADVVITLKASGNPADGTTLTRTYGGTYGELPLLTHEKSAFTFLGWYTRQQGYNYQISTAAPVGKDDPITTLGDHSLYAHWSKAQHTCEYFTAETIPATCISGKILVKECYHCYNAYNLRYSQVDSNNHTTVTYADQGDGTHIGTCGDCGKAFPAQAHTPNDEGLCALCGATVPTDPTVVESWKLSHSLDLASDISMNYVLTVSTLADYTDIYLECELPLYEGNILTGSRIVRLEPVQRDSFYYFTLTDLHAGQMKDAIRATLYAKKGALTYCSAPDTYSIATYAYTQLGRSTTPAVLKTLCADLLRYGGWTQTYKGYRTDYLAHSDLTEAQAAYLTDLNTVVFGNHNTVAQELPNAPLTWKGKALLLESKVTLRFVFHIGNYTGALSSLKLKVTYTTPAGEAKTAYVTGPTPYSNVSGLYAFDFAGLTAAELRSVVSVTVYEGETPLTSTISYSADTYGNNRPEPLSTLCKALFAYSDSAKAYFTN
ncbi:MAG: leucine-rich repeat domain-containing protein [Oscillospiraceae bacterium]|nr:leucine-rich repeat domain-containing protein [Oscillospiraceae bacterium]